MAYLDQIAGRLADLLVLLAEARILSGHHGLGLRQLHLEDGDLKELTI